MRSDVIDIAGYFLCHFCHSARGSSRKNVS